MGLLTVLSCLLTGQGILCVSLIHREHYLVKPQVIKKYLS